MTRPSDERGEGEEEKGRWGRGGKGRGEEDGREKRDTTCCHPSLPVVTRCTLPSPVVTRCRSLPLVITSRHPLIPVVTRCHPSSSAVTRCHPSSRVVIRPFPPPLSSSIPWKYTDLREKFNQCGGFIQSKIHIFAKYYLISFINRLKPFQDVYHPISRRRFQSDKNCGFLYITYIDR